jgi:hypothetical protein
MANHNGGVGAGNSRRDRFDTALPNVVYVGSSHRLDGDEPMSIVPLSTHGECTVANDANTLPLLKGTLDLLILKTLSWGPMHGYGIATWLEDRSAGTLGVDDSALYQALQRWKAEAG